MSETQHTVAVLPSSTTAEVIRGRLEAEGIKTTTIEEESRFCLQVSEADFERAMKLLFPAPETPQKTQTKAPSDEAGQIWFCAHCGEEVHPQSDACWSCGKPRARVVTPPASKKIGPPASGAKSASATKTPGTATAAASAPKSGTAAVAEEENPASPPESTKSLLANPLVLAGAALIAILVGVAIWMALRGS